MKLTNSLVENLQRLIRLPEDSTPKSSIIIAAVTAAVLSRSTLLLHGPPGCAKSTLIKLIAKAFGIDGQWRINGTAGTKEEDLVGGLDLAALANGSRKVVFSPWVSAKMRLLDEVDKINPYALAPLLPVLAENEARVGTSVLPLAKTFTALTMNPPMAGQGNFDLPEAIKDRIDLEVFFPSTTFIELADIFEGVMNNGGDLVKAMPQLGTSEELTRMQDEVAALPISQEARYATAFYLHATSVCKKDAKVEMRNFPTCCADCELAEATLPCSKIAPLSARTGISALNLARGIAYLRGSDKVERADVDMIFPMVMSHRAHFPNAAIDSIRTFVPEFFTRLSGAVALPMKIALKPGELNQAEMDSFAKSADPLVALAVKSAQAELGQVGKKLKTRLSSMNAEELKVAHKKGGLEFKDRTLIDNMIVARKTVAIGLPDESLLCAPLFRDLFTSPEGEPFLSASKWDDIAAEGRTEQLSLGIGDMGVDVCFENGLLCLGFNDAQSADLFRERIKSALSTFDASLVCPYEVAGILEQMEKAGMLPHKGGA